MSKHNDFQLCASEYKQRCLNIMENSVTCTVILLFLSISFALWI